MTSTKLKILPIAAILIGTSCSSSPKESNEGFSGKAGEVKLITLDPGHFHAALVQKNSYSQVDNKVYVYAPEGKELEDHLSKIESYNNRAENPTHWEEIVYKGNDFIDKMISEKKGNVMVTAGNNRKKTEYIKKTLEAGINVLADKPMAINSTNFNMLLECFEIAKQKNVMLYDIMTERHEITTILQKELSELPEVYGEQLKGSADDPAIIKESVHMFLKEVSGSPLIRPAWFFDVEQQGEGIADVMTHLVDLVQWEAFPEQILDYKKDINIIEAKRWTTPISREDFKKVTALDNYPDFLQKDVENDTLKVYANGSIVYKLKDITAKVSVLWHYKSAEGGGDSHFSVMKGSKANLVIRQGKEQNFIPQLYIEAVEGLDMKEYEKALSNSMKTISSSFPGVNLTKQNDGIWLVNIPDKYRVGHEAHFGQVTENFLEYLKDGKLPDWEVPNMIAKYYTTTKALDLAKEE